MQGISETKYHYIHGYDNYVIGNDGEVINIKNKHRLNPRSNGRGYMQVVLYKDGVGREFHVHRLVAQYFLEGGVRDGVFVRHIDRDLRNNHINNLAVGPLLQKRIRHDGNYLDHIYEDAEARGIPKREIKPGVKKVLVALNQITGEVRRFPNANQASIALRVNSSNIYAQLKGLRSTVSDWTFEEIEQV